MNLNKIALLSSLVVSGLSVSSIIAPAKALTIPFINDFSSENEGLGKLNYNGFENFKVIDGTVDLIGSAGFYDLYPDYGGLYVDLDGSTKQAGTLMTKTAFNLSIGTYILSFDLGGSQREGDPNIVDVALGDLFSKEYTRYSKDALTLFTETIDVTASTTAYLSFHNLGGDNVGAVLGGISLTPVEIPNIGYSAIPLRIDVPEPLNIFGATAGLAFLGTASVAIKKRKLNN